NHAIADVAWQALKEVGPPVWDEKAKSVVRTVQKEAGVEPMDEPLLDACTQLIDPREAETKLRETLPAHQKYFTSDDYTDMTWHAPTARIYIARPSPAAPPGFAYPNWAMNALGGISETIDPMVLCASKTVALTMIRLLTDKDVRQKAWQEFEQRTGGGIK